MAYIQGIVPSSFLSLPNSHQHGSSHSTSSRFPGQSMVSPSANNVTLSMCHTAMLTQDISRSKFTVPYARASVNNVSGWILWVKGQGAFRLFSSFYLDPWLDPSCSISTNANVKNCLDLSRVARIRSRGSMCLLNFQKTSKQDSLLVLSDSFDLCP